MSNSGDAAEQIVRLAIDGAEMSLRIVGEGVKTVLPMLAAALKASGSSKTKGKASLTKLIKSGAPLKIFKLPQTDLRAFVKNAKRYGVLYHLVRSKKHTAVDIIARAEDAAKIDRIVEKLKMAATKNPTTAQNKAAHQSEQNSDTLAASETTKTTNKESVKKRLERHERELREGRGSPEIIPTKSKHKRKKKSRDKDFGLN